MHLIRCSNCGKMPDVTEDSVSCNCLTATGSDAVDQWNRFMRGGGITRISVRPWNSRATVGPCSCENEFLYLRVLFKSIRNGKELIKERYALQCPHCHIGVLSLYRAEAVSAWNALQLKRTPVLQCSCGKEPRVQQNAIYCTCGHKVQGAGIKLVTTWNKLIKTVLIMHRNAHEEMTRYNTAMHPF